MTGEFREEGKQLSGLEQFNALNDSRRKAVEQNLNKREIILLNCLTAILTNSTTRFPESEISLNSNVKRHMHLAVAYTNEFIRRIQS